MGLLLVAILLLGNMACAQQPAADAAAKPEAATSSSQAKGLAGDLMTLPGGKSTIIGGTIASVDPVTDELVLKVFGARRMRIFYDQRTQVYRDGAKTSLRDLHENEHASVETMLDGSTVFARSIHMLSQSPEGEAQGQVVSYDSGTGTLTLSEALSREAIRLHVPSGTTIVREGQGASPGASSGVSALRQGALIRASFQPDNKGQGVASKIAVLAMPGDQLTFTGNISFIDVHKHQFVVVDDGNNQDYKISFDPASFPDSHDLHEGTHVKVTAEFDGRDYVAHEIAIR
jgi:UPF0716 family protein affecting phage T7 exclusion